MIKKLLMACLALCLLLCGASALAEESLAGETLTVRLGDGAPIAYFDGYESDAVVDPAALRGVTGALDATLYMDFTQGGYSSIYELVNYTIRLQNIAVTDDYIALFTRLEYERPIPFPEGRMQYHMNHVLFILPIMQGGAYVGVNPVVQEGHLLDEKTLAHMVVYPLEQPLDLSQPISLYADWAQEEGPTDGLHLLLDASARSDPATVATPNLTLPTQPMNERSVSTTTITRIATTPFGLRVALDVLDDGRTYGFGYVVLDDQGRYLQRMESGWSSHSLASAEHPQHIYNDLWLLTTDTPAGLQFVPTAEDYDAQPQEFYHYIPFADMPADITLPSGAVVRVQGVDVEADGYLMRYAMPAFASFGLDIDLANAQGERLNLNVVSFHMPSLREQTQGYGGYWSEEYKGQTVAKVTPEQLAQVTGLAFHGWEYDAQLLMDQAVSVSLP